MAESLMQAKARLLYLYFSYVSILYFRMDNQIARLDWNDTFLDEDHLKHSFPSLEKRFIVKDPSCKPRPPFMYVISFVVYFILKMNLEAKITWTVLLKSCDLFL